MWKKIRRFYWYRRDRGLGKQTIAMAAMLLLMVIILAGAIAKSVVTQKALRNEAEIPANTATGPAISISPATGAAVLGEETDSEGEPSNSNKSFDVDTIGLSSFLGFMSESAFEDLENQLIVLCQKQGCKSAKKLTYQQTKNTFDALVGWQCLSVRLQSEELCGRNFADKLYRGRCPANERTTITGGAGKVEKAATGRKEKTAKT